MRGRTIPLPETRTGRLLVGAVALLVIIVALGTLSHRLVESNMDFIDALYATLNTVTTVGRGMTEFTRVGKIVSIVVMLSGIVTAMLVLGLVTRAMIEGQIRTLVGRKRMGKQIASLRDHVLLCGYGRMGRIIARELAKSSGPFVVIEQDSEAFAQVEEDGRLGFHGDAANDETLKQCGVEHARALISVTSSDADNVFVTLSARQLNPDICIIARVNEDSAIEKMRKAGADRVFSPYRVGGRQMALAALRPNVIDFLTEIHGAPGEESYQIEELRVEPGSSVCGRSLRELNLNQVLGVIIIGLRHEDQPMTYNPLADTKFEGNDILIALAPIKSARSTRRNGRSKTIALLLPIGWPPGPKPSHCEVPLTPRAFLLPHDAGQALPLSRSLTSPTERAVYHAVLCAPFYEAVGGRRRLARAGISSGFPRTKSKSLVSICMSPPGLGNTSKPRRMASTVTP